MDVRTRFQLAWRAYTARPWAMIADAVIMVTLIAGLIYWLA